MTRRAILNAGLLAVLAAAANAQIVSAAVDILSTGDPGYQDLPANLLVVDCFVDVAETDVWTSGRISIYCPRPSVYVLCADDANTPDADVVINPSRPFVSFVSLPLPRDSSDRYRNAGVVGGGGNGWGDTAYFTATWERAVPADQSTPSVDGYVARIVFWLGADAGRRDHLVVSAEPPPAGAVLYASTVGGSMPEGWRNRTLDFSGVHRTDWYLFDPVPEPATLALLFGGAALLRQRRE